MIPAARAMLYALTVHCRLARSTCSDSWMRGSAVATTSVSRHVMKNAVEVRTSTHPVLIDLMPLRRTRGRKTDRRIRCPSWEASFVSSLPATGGRPMKYALLIYTSVETRGDGTEDARREMPPRVAEILARP